jgi:hypothetical protein
VISEARKHKIRLILSLCNNWEDYGGKAQYVRWGKEAGLDLTSHDDFFSDPTIKSYYKAFVKVNFVFACVARNGDVCFIIFMPSRFKFLIKANFRWQLYIFPCLLSCLFRDGYHFLSLLRLF